MTTFDNADRPRWRDETHNNRIDFDLSESSQSLRFHEIDDDLTWGKKLLNSAGRHIGKAAKKSIKPISVVLGLTLIGLTSYKGAMTIYDEFKNGDPARDVAKAAGPGDHVGCMIFDKARGTNYLVTAGIDAKNGKAQVTKYRKPNANETITVAIDTVTNEPVLNADGTPALDAAGKPKTTSVQHNGENVDITSDNTSIDIRRPRTKDGTYSSVTLKVSQVTNPGKNGRDVIESACRASVTNLGAQQR